MLINEQVQLSDRSSEINQQVQFSERSSEITNVNNRK